MVHFLWSKVKNDLIIEFFVGNYLIVSEKGLGVLEIGCHGLDI